MASLFSLEGSQRVLRNAWVNLAELQVKGDQRGRVNALLVHDTTGKADEASKDELNHRLRDVVTLDDYGLSITLGGNNESVLNARGTYVPAPVVEAAEEASRAADAPLRRVSVYLVNTLALAGDGAAKGKAIHYAVVAGVDGLDAPGRGSLAPDEIALNQWAAEQLGAKVGDRVTFAYY